MRLFGKRLNLLPPFATKVPFLSIPKLVAEQAKTAGYKRVGLLATPTTLGSTLYDNALSGIADIVRPDFDFAEQIERYIYKQLNDNLSEVERNTFKLQVAEFKKKRKLDAVILGCIELPLVYRESLEDSSVLDTLQILGNGLLSVYFAN